MRSSTFLCSPRAKTPTQSTPYPSLHHYKPYIVLHTVTHQAFTCITPNVHRACVCLCLCVSFPCRIHYCGVDHICQLLYMQYKPLVTTECFRIRSSSNTTYYTLCTGVMSRLCQCISFAASWFTLCSWALPKLGLNPLLQNIHPNML